jgi:predicted TIM-barrel fold metal-dependent hydrolase
VQTTNSWDDYAKGTTGADISIVFNIDVPDPVNDVGTPGDPDRINDTTADFAKSDPRRIGFMSVHPLRPDRFDEVERCVELGLVGIKLGANYQRFDPLCEEAFALYALAEQRGLPILFHQGASPIQKAPLRYAYPLVTDEIAIRHPELRIVMAHLGHPWVRETIVTVRKHPNVYADVSGVHTRPWMLYEGLVMAMEWGVLPKLLFGSDFPVTTTSDTLAGLRGVNHVASGGMPRLPEEAIESIIQADALAALRLPHPGVKDCAGH